MSTRTDPALNEFIERLKSSNNIVFFGGAGVSTASGIPDFRSPSGLYQALAAEDRPWADYPPEELLSHDFFIEHPEWFYRYYREAILHPEAQPNSCHLALAEWEQVGRLAGVITQNIDGLHQAAGSRQVVELHGTVWQNYCMACGKRYTLDEILPKANVPRCNCGGTIRPAVTLYQEALPAGSTEVAVKLLREADLLIVAGTSLAVYPAAGLVNYFGGEHIVVINLSPTALDSRASLHLNRDLDEVFSQVRDVFNGA